MDMEQELETERLLRQSPSMVSDISDSSVPTIIGTPSPHNFHHLFDYGHLSASLPSIGECAKSAPEESDSGHHQPSVSSDCLPRVPSTHAKAWDRYGSGTGQFKGDEHLGSLKPLPKPLSTGSDQRAKDEKPSPHVGFEAPPAFHGSELSHCFSFTFIAAALWATTGSCLWLVLAIKGHTWGYLVSSRSGISSADASTICTLLAKSIELAFTTAFIAFLGQNLSGMACFNPAKGVTLAEMSMRTWVVQPGTIFSQLQILKPAVRTPLGALTLLVALLAFLYTSASDTLGNVDIFLLRCYSRTVVVTFHRTCGPRKA